MICKEELSIRKSRPVYLWPQNRIFPYNNSNNNRFVNFSLKHEYIYKDSDVCIVEYSYFVHSKA